MSSLAFLGFSLSSLPALLSLSAIYGLAITLAQSWLGMAGPRVLLIIVALTSASFADAYDGGWVVPFVGFLFLPGATLAYSDAWHSGIGFNAETRSLTYGHLGILDWIFVLVFAAADVYAIVTVSKVQVDAAEKSSG